MDARSFSSAFHRSVALLLKLHRVMTTGDPDGGDADAIREAMEHPWYAMSSYEQQLVRGLSADLYSIGEDREVPPDVRSDLVQASMDALKNGHCEELLQILRNNQNSLPPDSVAFLRGMAWSLFGQYEVAVEFFEEAAQLSNYQWPTFIHGLLTAQIAAGKSQEAFDLAERTASQSDDPLLLLDAAEVYFVRSTEVDPELSTLIQQKAVDIAKRASSLAEKAEQNQALRRQRALVLLWLALFYLSLDEVKSANEASNAAHDLADDDPNVLFIQEIITQRSTRESWDKGIGKVMARFVTMPTAMSSRLTQDLVTAN